jgi:transposase
MIDTWWVAKGYVPLRRDELMLLPPDVRDWLPAGHVVWFLLDVVAVLDTSVLHRRARLGGAGRAPYDPDMLLAVLLYAYAGGLRSSRRIERRCREDVAFMVLSGLGHPDHVTIARFRQDHDAAVEELFVEVLRLCGRAGMGRLEHVAIDGTKIAADASRARSRDAAGLRATARRLLDEAAATDEAEDARYGPARGDELPEDLRDPARRRQVIDDLVSQAGQDPDRNRGKARAGKARQASQALSLLDDVEADAAEAGDTALAPAIARVERAEAALQRLRALAQAATDDRARREAAAAGAGRTLPGTRPVPVEQQARVRNAVARLDRDRQRLAQRQQAAAESAQATGKRNLTDPDSRFMPVRGGGFLLGYNAQLAVSADHLILAVDLVQDTGDEHQLVPMLNHLDTAVTLLRDATDNPHLTVGVALFDAGYASTDNLTAPGPDRLIALGKRHHIAGEHPPASPPDTDAPPRQHMAWQLSTPQGRTLYKKRGATVEPVNSHLKETRGLRRFIRRGLTAAKAELTFAALTTNLLRLHTHQTQPSTT